MSAVIAPCWLRKSCRARAGPRFQRLGLLALLLAAEVRAAAEHADAEEEAEIVPPAAVGHRVDRDPRVEQRADPGEREHEPVPQAPPEAGRLAGMLDRPGHLPRAGGEEQQQ